jgi:hypothetical protein
MTLPFGFAKAISGASSPTLVPMRPEGVMVWSEAKPEESGIETTSDSCSTGTSSSEPGAHPQTAAANATPDITIIVFIMFASYGFSAD